MRNDNHGPAFLCQFLHGIQNILHQFRVKRGSRFVKQHQFRLNRQCSGNADTLLLTAGKLVGVEVNLIAQTDFFKQFDSLFTRLSDRLALYGNRSFHDVFQRSFVRKEVVLLEHHAGFAAQCQNIVFAWFFGKIDA